MQFNFTEILIIVLLGLLFFKEQIIPFITQKLGIKNGNGNNGYGKILNEIAESQSTLKAHYNEETTEILKEIRDNLKSHDQLERDSFTLLKEFKEYGIPCREKK